MFGLTSTLTFSSVSVNKSQRLNMIQKYTDVRVPNSSKQPTRAVLQRSHGNGGGGPRDLTPRRSTGHIWVTFDIHGTEQQAALLSRGDQGVSLLSWSVSLGGGGHLALPLSCRFLRALRFLNHTCNRRARLVGVRGNT